MKKHLAILLLLTLFSCTNTAKNEEVNESLMDQSYFRHLSYLINIKNEVAQKHWPDFAENDFYQPVVYYSRENTIVLNPSEHIRKITDRPQELTFNKVPVIKLPETYTDTTSLRFSNSITSDSTFFHYMQPVLYFQSYELTKKFLQDDLVDIQDWSIMVIHEFFHAYQWSIPEMFEYTKTVQKHMPGGPDKFLGSYHKDLEWYKESVKQENELLKAIWIDGADLIQNLNKYDSLRNERIERVKREYDVDIRPAEDYEITIEGQARYFESLIKRYLSKNNPEAVFFTKEDKEGITNMFKGYDVVKDRNLFNIYNNRYYYPIGYNISMILEKYNVDYKNSFYREEQNIHHYLKELKSSQQ
ncbi:hypothetical protein RXV94_11560 [Yeosuana sp. MJ-SS3]|uniref:Aminopeptidase n=1 Tax=Gilvirhabdus luticola TaxID=3079858 RepID=A0ABU3U8Z3_9FLAO|nr:hypothetical protein [Yeosuana sp. MJ-SS3]MDU8886799.1 hypothetical protein [Yeosuana sp. MJ-SS3]